MALTENDKFNSLLLQAADTIVQANTRRIQIEQQAFATEQAMKEQVRHAKLQQDSLKLQQENFELEKQKFAFQQQQQKEQMELEYAKLNSKEAIASQRIANTAAGMKAAESALDVQQKAQNLREDYNRAATRQSSLKAFQQYEATQGLKTPPTSRLDRLFSGGVESTMKFTEEINRLQSAMKMDPATGLITAPELKKKYQDDIANIQKFMQSGEYQMLVEQETARLYPPEVQAEAAQTLGFSSAEVMQNALAMADEQAAKIDQNTAEMADKPALRAMTADAPVTPDAVKEMRKIYQISDRAEKAERAKRVLEQLRMQGVPQARMNELLKAAQDGQSR